MQVQTFSPPLPAQVLPESIVLCHSTFTGKSLYFCQSPEQFQSSLSASDGTPVRPTHIGYLSFSVSFQGFLHNGVFEVNLYCRCRHLMVLPKERGEDKAKVRIAKGGEKNCLQSFVTAKTLQLCLTLCDPTGYRLPGSSVHGILQVRILEWVAMPSSKKIFPTQGSNPHLLCLLHWQVSSLPTAPPGKPLLLHKYTLFFLMLLPLPKEIGDRNQR